MSSSRPKSGVGGTTSSRSGSAPARRSGGSAWASTVRRLVATSGHRTDQTGALVVRELQGIGQRAHGVRVGAGTRSSLQCAHGVRRQSRPTGQLLLSEAGPLAQRPESVAERLPLVARRHPEMLSMLCDNRMSSVCGLRRGRGRGWLCARCSPPQRIRSVAAAGWRPPGRLELPTGHHLRPIRSSDVNLHLRAVLESQERLWVDVRPGLAVATTQPDRRPGPRAASPPRSGC